MGKHDIAIDGDGHILPYSPEEVRAITVKALTDGNLAMIVTVMPSGDYAVQVMGPPSDALADLLEQVATSYRQALKGH